MLGTQEGIKGRLGLGLGLHEALQPLVEFFGRNLHVLTQSGGRLVLSLGDQVSLNAHSVDSLDEEDQTDDDRDEKGQDDVKLGTHDHEGRNPLLRFKVFPYFKGTRGSFLGIYTCSGTLWFIVHLMANIVGIDLGTSTTVVARFNAAGTAESTNNADGDQLTASIVHIEPDGVVTCGKEAKKLVGLGYDNVFSEFKREMGGSQSWQVNGRTITPEDLSGYLLKQVMTDYVQQFGQPDTTVISWPANFTDRQKVATQEAARRSGLNVQYFINEPTAAALYYTLSLKLNGTFLVYDMGGGTFDVTVVEVKGFDVRVIFSEGVARLGGADMDAAMLGIIAKKFKQLTGGDFDRVDCSFTQLDVESPKHSLSTRDSTDIRVVSIMHGPVKITITRTEFEDAIRPLIQQAEKSCTDMLSANNIDRSSLREVFMVGGTSRIPALQESVQNLFGRKPVIREPDHAVARGVAIYAALKTDPSKLTQLQRNAIGAVKVIDITPHYFGIGLHEPYSATSMFNRVLIDKGLPVPYSIVKRFHTSEGENKTGIQLIITQSPRSERDITKVKMLHNKYVPINPRGNVGEQIEVTFSYDGNGVMECILHEISTGKKTQLNLQAD